MKKYGVLLSIGLAVAGCTSMSKQECESANWQEHGFNSALKGETLPHANEYYGRQCTERHSVAVDGNELATGYENGLKHYCTPQNATRVGESLDDYQGICPKELEPNFVPVYNSALIRGFRRRVRQLESEVDSLRSQLSSAESEISSLRSQISRQ